MIKSCVKCQIVKNTTEFGAKVSAKDGLQSWCKTCKKAHYLSNRFNVIEKQKLRYLADKDNINKYKSEWQKQNQAHRKSYLVAYRKTNKEHINAMVAKRNKQRSKTDPVFRFIKNLRRRMHHAFKGENKSQKTKELLGCDLMHAFKHIESQFQAGMSWENYGQWHIDHIFPLSRAQSIQDLEKLCHYTNLQPLWAKDNLKKSCKLPKMIAQALRSEGL